MATDAAGIPKMRQLKSRIRRSSFHEWRAETLAQHRGILAELRRQGCTFLTLSELATTLTPDQLAVAH